MQSLPAGLGNSRYEQLRQWLDSPAMRVQRVLQVTAQWWWPDGAPSSSREARRALRRSAAAACRHRVPLRSSL